MLLATKIEREFAYKKDSQDLILPDPNPSWNTDEVLSFLSNEYPEFTTATVSGSEYVGKRLRYHIKTVVGTKG